MFRQLLFSVCDFPALFCLAGECAIRCVALFCRHIRNVFEYASAEMQHENSVSAFRCGFPSFRDKTLSEYEKLRKFNLLKMLLIKFLRFVLSLALYILCRNYILGEGMYNVFGN